VLSLGRKSLTQFNVDKDEWYYQPKVYINRQDSESLYTDLKEFRQSLSQDHDNDFTVGIKELLAIDKMNGGAKKPIGECRMDDSEGISSKPESLNPSGFFSEKLKLLKEEIEDINRNLEERNKVENSAYESIESEIREIKRYLHEVYTWKKGDKQTIELLRMEFLRQLASLNQEKRKSRLGFWKDRVFEKKDRRNLLFEYKSLDWAGNFDMKDNKERQE
jgi:hypothetical protein